jgi:hypothetical protein
MQKYKIPEHQQAQITFLSTHAKKVVLWAGKIWRIQKK